MHSSNVQLLQTELLKQLSDILKNGGNSPVARMQAGIQLKNALYSKDANVKLEYQQRWLQFPEDVRSYVKQNVSCLAYFVSLTHDHEQSAFSSHFTVINMIMPEKYEKFEHLKNDYHNDPKFLDR